MPISAEQLKGAVVTDTSQLTENLITVTCTDGTKVVLDLWNYYLE